MNIKEAKTQILHLLLTDLGEELFDSTIQSDTPKSSDPGKFELLGSLARTIHRFNQWNIPINPSWFSSENNPPVINGEEFYWYAFAIPKYSGFQDKYYFICDYLQMINWVLDFSAPLDEDHSDRRYWRADLQVYDLSGEQPLGFFRWGDEKLGDVSNLKRIIRLNNIWDLIQAKGHESPLMVKDRDLGYADPLRVKTQIGRIIRNTEFGTQLKVLYGNRCQICGLSVGIETAEYSEAHHIKPLGSPHNGPDKKSNILILCPNHHAEFDYGYLAISPDTLRVIHADEHNQYHGSTLRLDTSHKINTAYLSYHLEKIFVKNPGN